ncbi:MAG: hypothetical protein WA364_28080, partial [Candidatus Nitrosopolaris sp.]
RAGSGLTRISNLLPSAVRRTVVILVSTIYLVEEFYLKYIYAWIMEFITLFGELLVNIGESISNADQRPSMPEILKKFPTICFTTCTGRLAVFKVQRGSFCYGLSLYFTGRFLRTP